ncbi:LysR family glycine cleavage system transcriptional activator [Pararhizobium capsulatum DSM 1112]|uniref:LysR family glycine cleavage system transcriptional activator n=1 Tax=Pararhizobium capsulatum DSM 1112 TaxID=1121113 RepID=A0ABU0BSR0_9HYPH|nr:LysR substrate-binding domain-containing protein [Pararhizobium capsulatum]MDQ0321301.1 LysR family glycine cleavage system transcriptional activator [Pararhizobium capsulatum DSM 1112]
MKLSRQMPLNALRVFEAAARLMSFTRAGEELGMTQTAVSYQIKLLEDHIGEPLFLRRPRQISLTEAGERLAPKVTQGFAVLAEAMASVSDETGQMLHLDSTATFAQQWLTRYLGSFQLRHPNIAVRLSTSPVVNDFASTQADVAIRYGRGLWPGLKAHRIMRMDFAPMLSPKLAEQVGGIREPADLLKLSIISAGDVWWEQWFTAAGVKNPNLKRFPPNELGTQSFDAGMAIAGQGVAILNPQHFQEEVESGRLYQPFSLTCNDGRDYWLVYLETRRHVPKIRAFKDWMLSEFPSAEE